VEIYGENVQQCKMKTNIKYWSKSLFKRKYLLIELSINNDQAFTDIITLTTAINFLPLLDKQFVKILWVYRRKDINNGSCRKQLKSNYL
jgi:hypothetical protein